MFEFESQLRSADPAMANEAVMPDFIEMARRIESGANVAATTEAPG